MIGDIRLRTKEFFTKYCNLEEPILLGYSGGPDSKALLYLLLEHGYRPHVAHVDHSWRRESAQEAESIKNEIEGLDLVFHTTKIEPVLKEAIAREARLEFFSSLFKKTPFQALLLAHQADDWAETALKRTLEGAHLIYLSGMAEEKELSSMKILRPLLKTTKQEILEYLNEKKLTPFFDPTNLDPRYLRARMRTNILPGLAQIFGKEVSKNLALLAERSNELKRYLDKKTDGALELVEKGVWGLRIPPILEDKVEIRHLLQRLNIPFTRTILEGVTDSLKDRVPRRRFGRHILADRGWFYYFNEEYSERASRSYRFLKDINYLTSPL